jgi:hypothetical protein
MTERIQRMSEAMKISPIEIILVSIVVTAMIVVAPLGAVMYDHIVRLERRTAILCPHGLPAPNEVRMIPLDGCAP